MWHMIDLTVLNPTESKAILGELTKNCSQQRANHEFDELQPSATGGSTLGKKKKARLIHH